MNTTRKVGNSILTDIHKLNCDNIVTVFASLIQIAREAHKGASMISIAL